jgi:hypothetical protein
MAGNNLTIGISAETAKLQSQLAVAKASYNDFASQIRSQSKQIAAESDAAIRGQMVSALDALIAKQNEVRTQIRGTTSEIRSALSKQGLPTDAIDGLGKSMDSANSHSGSFREGIVLLHETIQGRFNRIPGSLLVLSETFGGLSGKAIGAAIGIGGLAAAIFEVAKSSIETNSELRSLEGTMALFGQVPAGGASAIRQQVQTIATSYNLSTIEAAKFSDAIQGSMRVADQSARDNAIKIVASLAAIHNELDKLPDIAKAFGEKTQSFSGLKEISDKYGLGLDSLIATAEQKGETIKATQSNLILALEQQLDDYNTALEKRSKDTSFAGTAARYAAGDIGAAGFSPPEQLAVPKPLNPSELITASPNAGNEDPTAILKRNIADAEAQVRSLTATWKGSAAERAAAERDIYAKIQVPAGIDREDPELQKLRNEQGRTGIAAGTTAARQQIQAIEAQYAALDAAGNLSAQRRAALEVEKERKILAVGGQTVDEQVAEQQRLTTAQAALGNAAAEEQIKALERVAEADKRGTTQKLKDLEAVAAAYQRLGRGDTEGAKGNQEKIAQTKREIGEREAKAVDEGAVGDIEAIKQKMTDALDAAKINAKGRIIADPNELAQEQAEIIRAGTAAIDAIEEKRIAAANDDIDQAKRIANEKAKIDQQAQNQIAHDAREAALQVEEEWNKVNKQIGDSLGSAIVDGLSGKKGGITGALTQLLENGAKKAIGSGIDNALSFGEKQLGISGQSPGNLINSGLDSLGLQGVGSFFGLGGNSDGSGAALTTAGATLTTAGAGLNTAAAALSAAAAAQGASGGVGDVSGVASASGGGGGILSDVLDILPFASGGRPPTGQPSLIGENGPELFVPDGSGTIIPNNRLPGFSGGASYGLPEYAVNDYTQPPAGVANIDASRGGDTNNATLRQNITINASGRDRALHEQAAQLHRSHGKAGVRALMRSMGKR